MSAGSNDSGDRELRRDIRAELIRAGCPLEKADEVVDLGMHAQQRALSIILEVTSQSPDKAVTIAAGGVAIGIAIARLQKLQTSLEEMSEKLGIRTERITIEGGVHV